MTDNGLLLIMMLAMLFVSGLACGLIGAIRYKEVNISNAELYRFCMVHDIKLNECVIHDKNEGEK